MEAALPRATRGFPRRPPEMLAVQVPGSLPHTGAVSLGHSQQCSFLSRKFSQKDDLAVTAAGSTRAKQRQMDQRLPGTRAAARASQVAAGGRHSCGLQQQDIILSQLWMRGGQDQGVRRAGVFEASLLGLHMATFLLCPLLVLPLCVRPWCPSVL